MDAPAIVEFLRSLGIPASRIKVGARYVSAPCPLAKWNHSKGYETSVGSFGVKIMPKGSSSWRCHTCARGGVLNELLWLLREKTQRAYGEQAAFVSANNHHDIDAERERAKRVAAEAGAPPRPRDVGGINVTPAGALRAILNSEAPPVLPEEDLERNFVPIEEGSVPYHYLIAPYPEGRGMPRDEALAVARRWELLWQPEAHRVALVIRDVRHRLVGVSGRLVDQGKCIKCRVKLVQVRDERAPVSAGAQGDRVPGPAKMRTICPKCRRAPPAKFLHSKGFRRDFFLFGEHHVGLAMERLRDRRAEEARAKLLASSPFGFDLPLPPQTEELPKLPCGFVVEGHFDAVALWRHGYPAVAIMGSYLSPLQVEKLARFFERLVVFPDGDKAGQEIAKRVHDAMSPRLPVSISRAVEGRDPDQYDRDELRDILGPPSLEGG